MTLDLGNLIHNSIFPGILADTSHVSEIIKHHHDGDLYPEGEFYPGLDLSHLKQAIDNSEDESDIRFIRIKSQKLQVKYHNHIYKQGDIVLLNSGGKNPYLAIIIQFIKARDEYKFEHLWFALGPEIRKEKRPADYHPAEAYITSLVDTSPIESIIEKARVLSYEDFSKEHNQYGLLPATFFCRRGLHLRKLLFTDTFDWNLQYVSRPDKNKAMDSIVRKIEYLGKLNTPKKEQETPKKIQTPVKITRSPNLIIEKLEMDSNSESVSSMTSSDDEFNDSDEDTEKPRKRRRKEYIVAYPAPSKVDLDQVEPLQGRSNEFNKIYQTLEKAIQEVAGTSIYISGTPGTGKTATVRRVIALLHKQVKNKLLDDFIYCEVNAMKLSSPQKAYQILYEVVCQRKSTALKARRSLNQLFSAPSPSRTPIVVFMDELDRLVTKSNNVIYDFFNWPTLPGSQLIVIGCANTMDLPERMLQNKITSRMGLETVGFEAYEFSQLVTIIENHVNINGQVLIESNAVGLIARKIASVNGDARRAISIAKRAIELARSEKAEEFKQANIIHVRKAFQMATMPTSFFVESLPWTCRLFLLAMLNIFERKGSQDFTLSGECFEEVNRIKALGNRESCIKFNKYASNCVNRHNILQILQDSGILAIENSKRSWSHRRCKLQIPDADIKVALDDVKRDLMKA